MLFRGLTSIPLSPSMVWSHGFVRAVPETHAHNIVPVSSSISGWSPRSSSFPDRARLMLEPLRFA